MAKTPSTQSTDKTTTSSATSYRVLTGINYGPEDKRAEVGDIVSDLPPESVSWLLASNDITTDLDPTPPPPTDQMDAPGGGQESPDTQGSPAPAAPADPIVEE